MIRKTFLLFCHQLFEQIEPLRDHCVYLIEPPLFFTQYRFHVQKLMLHRASMRFYQEYLVEQGIEVVYVEVEQYEEILSDLAQAVMYDVADDYLLRSIRSMIDDLTILSSPSFYDMRDDTRFMHHYYILQRKRLGILIKEDGPVGGSWSYDDQNRQKIPKGKVLPSWQVYENDWIAEAREYVKQFESFGEAAPFYYPVTFSQAREALAQFLSCHFEDFGSYQDAMQPEDSPLFHSLLSSAINSGLLNPREVVAKALQADVPLNAKEGFIRQIIGWREFMRQTYEAIGVAQRTRNYFGFTATIPAKVLAGGSGLLPVDDVMSKVHRRGYAHHIERLMILGNYFLLTERAPNAVYAFFMAGFIDAYDWVMVGNVYGMSQYADGGMITTKPYISSSNYIRKMSHYPKGEWCEIWDALYWRFVHTHRALFASNHRTRFTIQGLKRMKPEKLQQHLERSEAYLEWLES
jgi:deoxyribodipyrimidine photolyase-related protein